MTRQQMLALKNNHKVFHNSLFQSTNTNWVLIWVRHCQGAQRNTEIRPGS